MASKGLGPCIVQDILSQINLDNVINTFVLVRNCTLLDKGGISGNSVSIRHRALSRLPPLHQSLYRNHQSSLHQ